MLRFYDIFTFCLSRLITTKTQHTMWVSNEKEKGGFFNCFEIFAFYDKMQARYIFCLSELRHDNTSSMDLIYSITFDDDRQVNSWYFPPSLNCCRENDARVKEWLESTREPWQQRVFISSTITTTHFARLFTIFHFDKFFSSAHSRSTMWHHDDDVKIRHH